MIYQNIKILQKDDIGNMLTDFNKNKESYELGTLDILQNNEKENLCKI